MSTTELKLQDLFKLEFKECRYGNGIVLEADILDYDKSLGELSQVAKKLYFRVDTGPYNYALPGGIGWGASDPDFNRPVTEPPKEAIIKPDNYICWRLPQHERRLWQAGFPVYFGYYPDDNNPIEIELDSQTADILKKDFD